MPIVVQKHSNSQASGEEFFDELQALWDVQNRRIDKLIAEADEKNTAHESHLDSPQKLMPYRLRMLIVYALLSVVSVSAAVYWATLIHTLAFDTVALITSITIEIIYLIFVVESLYWTVSLLVYNPSRVGILRMSRFMRRTRMRTHYSPNPMPSRKNPKVVIFINHIRHSTRQAVAACIVAMVVLVVASCTDTGDGHTITQNYPDRDSTVVCITNTLIGLCTL